MSEFELACPGDCGHVATADDPAALEGSLRGHINATRGENWSDLRDDVVEAIDQMEAGDDQGEAGDESNPETSNDQGDDQGEAGNDQDMSDEDGYDEQWDQAQSGGSSSNDQGEAGDGSDPESSDDQADDLPATTESSGSKVSGTTIIAGTLLLGAAAILVSKKTDADEVEQPVQQGEPAENEEQTSNETSSGPSPEPLA